MDTPLGIATTAEHRAKFYRIGLSRSERAWKSGSVPALVDALILCQKGQIPPPPWLTQGSTMLIKMLFQGKSLQTKGRLAKATARYRSHMLDLERYGAVRDLEDRREEMLEMIKRYTPADCDKRPQFAALAHDRSLAQRCAAVSELFEETNNQAKGSADTIMRSYKKVQREMKRGNIGPYYIPSYDNPLRQLY